MIVRVVTSRLVEPQYWQVTLACGHTQTSHSTRDCGPAYVRRCETCAKQGKCSHKFVDSTRCLKCGWEPK